MAEWLHMVDISQPWGKVKEGKITHQKLASLIAVKLNKLDLKNDRELEVIVQDFKDLSDTPDATIQEFDTLMKKLWDWGDTSVGNKKRCWIGVK